MKSDYASVTEQSAIRSGDQGFDVTVAGDTDLKAGAITGTQQAIDDDRNRFETGGELTLGNIENKAEYSGKAVSLNLGVGFDPQGKLTPQGTSAGYGKTGDKAESTTLAAISGIAGNKDARTGDAETGLQKIFDADKVQKEIDAQVRITQIFGQLASKAVGDWAKAQTDKAQDLRRRAAAEPNDEKRASLEDEAQRLEDLWGDTGTLRLAAHTLIGTLTAPLVAEALRDADIDGPLAATLTALASTAAGAVAGGTPGAVAGLNEVGNNYLRHQEAIRLIALRNQKLRGNCDASCNQEIQRLETLDLQRNRDLAACEGVASGHCDSLRTEVRQAAAEYIRANQITPEFRYDDERRETLNLAANAMGGIRLTDRAAGYGGTVWEGISSLASGIVTGGKALLGDEQAKAAVRQGAGAAWDYVSNPENWPYLLGAMTPEDREKLAAAYETGDARTIGTMLGAQAANMPIGGGGFGTVRRVGKAADAVGDVARGATPFSNLVPGGGLAAHEAAGGHLLLKHVGQSESAFATRLAAEPRIPAASTFLSRSEAEAAVSAVLDVRAAEVATWVASGAKGQLVLNAPFNGGLVLQRGASAGTRGSGATVVLRGTGGGEWRIHTGYPTP